MWGEGFVEPLEDVVGDKDMGDESFETGVLVNHVETGVCDESSSVEWKEDALSTMTKDGQIEMFPFIECVEHLVDAPAESVVGTETIDARVDHA